MYSHRIPSHVHSLFLESACGHDVRASVEVIEIRGRCKSAQVRAITTHALIQTRNTILSLSLSGGSASARTHLHLRLCRNKRNLWSEARSTRFNHHRHHRRQRLCDAVRYAIIIMKCTNINGHEEYLRETIYT